MTTTQQPLHIRIDDNSGFCFGVVRAITTAEQELIHSGTLHCLGDIVHNGQEVKRLTNLGLNTISHNDFAQLHDTTILLRAHGEPPTTYQIARDNNIKIIDATCPVVLNLQKQILRAHTHHPHAQIVIYGKEGHAEVLGLVGQTGGKAIVVEDTTQLSRINFTHDIILFSQTTKSLEGFADIISLIQHNIHQGVDFQYYDTICRQVANRIPAIRAFATQYDTIIFVSGAKSSNGKVLFAECQSVNSNTYMVSTPDEIQAQWFSHTLSVGICGATSTPKWLMEAVAQRIKEI